MYGLFDKNDNPIYQPIPGDSAKDQLEAVARGRPNMNLSWAVAAMSEGIKVRHRRFAPGAYAELTHGGERIVATTGGRDRSADSLVLLPLVSTPEWSLA